MTISGSGAEAPLRDLLSEHIREVPDFPEPGVLFRDITPLLANAEAFAHAVEALAAPFASDGIQAVAGIESRGFLFGAPVALRLGAPFVALRKPGKLPVVSHTQDFRLEYGDSALELPGGLVRAGLRVLVVDDVLATGGTAEAGFRLLRRAGAVPVGFGFLLGLDALGGAARLRRLGARLHVVLDF